MVPDLLFDEAPDLTTPRDPLAALLGMAIHQTRHDNDDPDFVMATARKRADRILREFPDLATRPSGDEALRDDEVLALIGPDVEGLAVPVAFSHPHDPLRCPACDIVWSQGYATASKDAS
jgi:hypothetical protein